MDGDNIGTHCAATLTGLSTCTLTATRSTVTFARSTRKRKPPALTRDDAAFVTTLRRAPEWDGHTSKDVIDRVRAAIAALSAPSEATVERVARAIYETDPIGVRPWEDAPATTREDCFVCARAAIAAMGQVTDRRGRR
jgi:hypothetical protein